MNEIDQDMWKKQEDTNTILNYLCSSSDEEIAEQNKRINSWNRFQRKVYHVGNIFHDSYFMGLLDRTKPNSTDEDLFISARASLWGKTRAHLAQKDLDAKKDIENWDYLFKLYIKWFFVWIWNNILFTLKKLPLDSSNSELR